MVVSASLTWRAGTWQSCAALRYSWQSGLTTCRNTYGTVAQLGEDTTEEPDDTCDFSDFKSAPLTAHRSEVNNDELGKNVSAADGGVGSVDPDCGDGGGGGEPGERD